MKEIIWLWETLWTGRASEQTTNGDFAPFYWLKAHTLPMCGDRRFKAEPKPPHESVLKQPVCLIGFHGFQQQERKKLITSAS